MSATLTVGDTTYEVEVGSIEFTHERDDYYGRYYLTQFNRQFSPPEIKLEGVIREITVKEIDMGYRDTECEVAKDSGYIGESLAKKVKDLALSDDDRLLRKYNVVREDGTLTTEGMSVLLNVLFEENKTSIIEKLKALETAEKK